MISNLTRIFRSLRIKEDQKSIRIFGAGLTVILLILIAFQLLFGKEMSSWLLMMAIAIGGITLFASRWIKIIYYPWMVITKLLGLFLSYLILIILYYTVFTPLGLILRMRGHDPMKSAHHGDSYWVHREQSVDKRMNRMF